MNGYVAAGYAIPLASLAAYTAWVLRRGRTLTRSRAGARR
jgi:hypothetical protein